MRQTIRFVNRAATLRSEMLCATLNCARKQLQRRPIPRRAIQGIKAACKKKCTAQPVPVNVPYLPAFRSVHGDEDGDEGENEGKSEEDEEEEEGGDDEGGGSGLRDDPEAALFDEHCDYKQMNLVALWDEETKTINIAGHVGKYLSGKSYGIWFNPEQTKSKPFTQRKYRPAWYDPKDGKESFSLTQPRRMKPSVADWNESEVLRPPGQFHFDRAGALSPECAAALQAALDARVDPGLASKAKRKKITN